MFHDLINHLLLEHTTEFQDKKRKSIAHNTPQRRLRRRDCNTHSIIDIKYTAKGIYDSRICHENIHYVTKRKIRFVSSKKNKGVRREDIIYRLDPTEETKQLHMLQYNNNPRPCLCGSTEHSTIYNINCILNPRYEDA